MGTETLTQGSDAWFNARLGIVTASRVNDVLSKGIQHEKYRKQLVSERITGISAAPWFSNAAMEWGKDHEAEARAYFEQETGLTVTECGMYTHPTLRAGASPDGIIVSESACLELKSPLNTTHNDYIDDGILPNRYRAQVQFQIACSGMSRSWFASYDPRNPHKDTFDPPKELRMFRILVERDDAYIAKIETAILAFTGEVDEMIERLTNAQPKGK